MSLRSGPVPVGPVPVGLVPVGPVPVGPVLVVPGQATLSFVFTIFIDSY